MRPRSPRRPAGPPAAERQRGRFGLLLPEVVTVRAMVLGVVVLLSVVLLLPTVRAYVNQTGELRALHGQLAAASAERDAAQVQLDRWDDRDYVIRQARDHLSFVMPGDTPWRVLGAPARTNPDAVTVPSPGEQRAGDAKAPWYESIWASVRVADGTTRTDADGAP